MSPSAAALAATLLLVGASPAQREAAAPQESLEGAGAEVERAADHFRVCDLDENGWVSFREASVTLGVDRSEYLTFSLRGE